MNSLNTDPNQRGRPPIPPRVTSQNPVLHSSSSQSPLDLSRSGQIVGNPRFPSQVTPTTQIDSQQREWDITLGQQQRPPPATSVSHGTFAYSTRSSSGSPSSSASSVCGSSSGCGSASSICDYREQSEITGAQDPSRQKCVCHLYCSQHASEYCPRHLTSSSSGGSCVIM